MATMTQRFAFQELLERVAEGVKDNPHGRSYLTSDNRAYVLAMGGDGAKAMHDFMREVGNYLIKMKSSRGDKEAARAEVLRAFDEWLAKQSL